MSATSLERKDIQKYAFIDALRGFAILGVVLIHTQDWILPANKVLGLVVGAGRYGVQLFFVASALTIFLSMNARSGNEANPVRNFLIRRFFRIAPLFYCAILFYTLIGGVGREYWAPNGLKWWFIPLTVLFMHGWHAETFTSVVPGSWSIAVEMTFYLFVPFIFAKLTDVRITSIYLLASLVLTRILSFVVYYLIAPYYPESQTYLVRDFLYLWFFEQVPVFLLGILMYHIFTKYQHIKDVKVSATLLVASIFLLVAFSKTLTELNLLPVHVLLGTAFCVLALALHFYPNRLFVNPVTIWIGRLSFGIYLIHFAVIKYLAQILPLGEHGNLTFVAAYLCVLILSTAIAFVLHRLVEQPGINAGRQLIKSIDRAMPSTPIHRPHPQ